MNKINNKYKNIYDATVARFFKEKRRNILSSMQDILDFESKDEETRIEARKEIEKIYLKSVLDTLTLIKR